MNMNSNFFLHLEGMDLSGKSTIAQKIKQYSSLEWVIHNNVLTTYNEIYKFICKISKNCLYDDEVYGFLYYTALLADIKNFSLTENVIQDSTLLLRSINYHLDQGNDKLVEIFEDLIKRHPVPNLSIYLTASIDSRVERLRQRILETPEKVSFNDKMILDNPQKFLEMDFKLASLSQKYFNSIIIDTSNLTEEETVKSIFDSCENDISGNNKVFIKKVLNDRK